MDQDETPLLIRHPLHVQHIATPKQVPRGTPESSDDNSDSDTDLEVMSVGSEVASDGEVEPELPNTQQIDPRPLAGLIVYVEVRSGTDSCENRQQAVAHQLELLGATVSQRLTKDVTHMVFKDGKQSTLEKAEKKGVYLVSPLWLDACKRANDRVSEAKYPVLCKDGSDSPVVLGRIKRMKSMQPKPLVEEITKSLERSRKRHKTDTPSRPVTCSKTAADRGDGSDEEDSYELPEIRLPGTPLSEVRITPVVGKGSTEVNDENRLTSLSGKGSTEVNAGDRHTPPCGKGSTDKEVSSDTTPVTGKGLTKEKVRTRLVASTDKGSTKKKAVAGTASSAKTAKKDQPKSRKSVTDSAGSKPVRRCNPSSRENDTLSTSTDVSKSTKSPLQVATTNRKSKQENVEEDCKPKKKKVRLQRRSFEKQLPTIVLTSMHTSDQETVHSIVEKLGRFCCAKTVCDSTTHVVCGSPRRTVNVLSASLRGCWVLSLDWVMKSLECGHWVSEDPYELSSLFPAARFYRIQRATSYVTYRPQLFKGCGSVFLASGTAPPTQQLEGLLTLGGGKSTTSHRKADVCVGCKSWSNSVKSVSEQWILDSISAHSLLPVDDYLLDSPHTRQVSPEL